MTISRIAGRVLATAGALAAFTGASVAMAGSKPYSGAAAAIPGTIQAENFDRGGERVSYHDTTPANSGGKYRPKEAVDIITSPETGGGFVVNNFQTGEWLVYSIYVAKAGYYDLEVRAASAFTNSAYHVEVDARPVTTSIPVPMTGDWNKFQWVGKQRIHLEAGQHWMSIAADQQYFDFDAIRLTQASAVSSTPYAGSPATVPGLIEAENFDRGGEAVAYHDTTSGNTGGQYRAEDVDVMAIVGGGTGYHISHFESGEWLAYTITVPTAGEYDIDQRVSSQMAGGAYHLEIDGQRLGSPVSVPNTGNWDTYQWMGLQRTTLAAGTHVLKVVSDSTYFNIDSIRIAAAASRSQSSTPSTSSANLLFRSGFDGAISINAPSTEDCWGTGCWQTIAGLDSTSGFNWPNMTSGIGGKFLLLTDPVVTTPSTVGNYLFNRIETVTGHTGASTRALYQQITKNQNGTGTMGASVSQNEFQFLPQKDVQDMYVSYWMKLQPDLVQKMNNLPDGPGVSGGGTWRAIFETKTGGQVSWGGPADNGDYRIAAYILTYNGNGQPYWSLQGDNVAGGNAPLVNNWSIENRNVPVPVGEWFKLEIFWHRSAGSDGRVWMAVNGQTIGDHRGPNVGANNMPVNRIMAPILYSSMAMPIYQWVDDMEVWDGFPSPGNNPPYAPH